MKTHQKIILNKPTVGYQK
jgi:hypothetical protein